LLAMRIHVAIVIAGLGLPLSGCSLLAGTDPSELREPDDNSVIADGAIPDAALADGPPPDAPVAECDDGVVCSGNTLVTCAGGVASSRACVFGCASATACNELVPSSVGEWTWREDLPDIEIAGDVTFDTGSCGKLTADAPKGVVMTQSTTPDFATLPDLCVVAADEFTVAVGARLTVFGARALVILASGDVTIAGVLDGSATTERAGPGGNGGGGSGPSGGIGRGPRGGSLGERDADSKGSGGGGGGALCGDGGDGGDGDDADGGEGGSALSNLFELSRLVGGSGGGMGAPRPGAGGFGGHGGGAMQISSRGTVTVSGSILVAGAGGRGGGNPALADWGAGGGGGSGGSLLLEAAVVVVNGVAVLAGGGGGGGAYTTEFGDAGSTGAGAETERAAGGEGAFGEGTGGAGSAPGDEDGEGGEDSTDFPGGNAGGGGGGSGCFVIRAKAWALGGATLHPAQEPGLKIFPPVLE
jgi:hypothetical protein